MSVFYDIKTGLEQAIEYERSATRETNATTQAAIMETQQSEDMVGPFDSVDALMAAVDPGYVRSPYDMSDEEFMLRIQTAVDNRDRSHEMRERPNTDHTSPGGPAS